MSAASPGASSPRRGRRRWRTWTRRLLALPQRALYRYRRRRTIRRSAKGRIDTARTWRRKRSWVRVIEILSYIGAAGLGLVLVWSIIVMLLGPGPLTNLNNRCDRYSAACSTAIGILIPLLSVALATAVFLFYRLRYVTSPVAKDARSRPQDLVETASPNIGTIVGRDALCQVIMEDVRHRDIRRPHLLVGGVGTGKTAVLVLLTKLLAEHKAVPVPIRLRDAKDSLNFRDMAYQRFLAMTEGRLLSTGEAEKVWRQLAKDDKVVIIADGLEEALTEGSAEQDRDNLIRLAIHRARELGLPLIIASRPHDPLRGADATIMELEPLSEEAALEFIARDNTSVDARRLDWIVETAGLTELPLYLQITRQLCQHDRLDHLSLGRSARKLDTRSPDRSRLRLHLLNTWMEALFDGHLMPAVPLRRYEREAAVKWLSALACIGLKEDNVDVKFEDYYVKQAHEQEASQSPKYAEIDSAVKAFLRDNLPSRHLDIRLAVAWGDQLQLVEAHGDGLRFRHSIMQAYLGSRFLATALKDAKFAKEASASLEHPGRELLIALVLYSRSITTARKGSPPAGAEQATPKSGLCSNAESIVDALKASAAKATSDVKKLDLYAASLEVDSFVDKPQHEEIAEKIAKSWSDIRSGDQRTLDEAKLGLVHRFGDAARAIAARRDRGPGQPDPASREAKLGLVQRFGDAARTVAARLDLGMSQPDPGYRGLLEIGCNELSYPIRLAVAQEIGAGGDLAFQVLHKASGNGAATVWQETAWPNTTQHGKLPVRGRNETAKNPGQGDQERSALKDKTLRGRTLCAWIMPLLVGSVNDHSGAAREELERWLRAVGDDDFGISLEVALAQGFKHAANRRVRHPHALPETRTHLAEQALEMLKKTRYWFSQLTLIQALCLWEMPDPGGPRDDSASVRASREGPASNPANAHGSNPEATVRRWLEAATNREHPFVAEAANLAVQALITTRPERFLWIDESGIVSSVGSRPAQAANYRKHHLWIPPSTGWTALDPRARQLVADVLLMLNLSERGQETGEIEQRLRRTDRSDLPPCLTRDRQPLDPSRTVGGLYLAPGSNCIDGCRFGLCPYPSAGVQPYRSELNEAFCRGQQTLLSRGLTAPWQAMPPGDMKRFWAKMAERARGGRADQDSD
jgi:hypothetical protein